MSNSNEGGQFELEGVRSIIAVASGKGGVGKSTVASNLAVALSVQGRNTGLLDADIYGPSQGVMLGVPAETRPEVVGDLLQPVMSCGLQCMSMSFLASAKTPAVWRGPMASGAMQQLLTQTQWRDLEYLIIDMPPGTGDIQLTLAQRVPVDGALIVTTPQDIALLDARKGIEMFAKVQVPVLGIIENMSSYRCQHCGTEEAIFGAGGGAAIAAEYDTALLASLPLELSTRELTDQGKPIVLADPDSDAAKRYLTLATEVIKAIESSTVLPEPKISVFDD